MIASCILISYQNFVQTSLLDKVHLYGNAYVYTAKTLTNCLLNVFVCKNKDCVNLLSANCQNRQMR